MTTPIIKNYGELKPNKAEILRYARGCNGDEATENLIDECLKIAHGTSANKVIYVREEVTPTANGVRIGNTEFVSQSLKKFVGECKEVVLFGATVGIGIDRLTEKFKATSVAKALILDAIGTEQIESLCDAFCKDIGACARFSPGYGDLDVAYQKEIFRILGSCGKIGLALNDSLLMSPSKSVTAIARVGGEVCGNKCASCENKTCVFKR